MRLAAAIGAMLLFAAGPAAAEQVRFTGNTTADATLIRDALQNILRHAYGTQGCASLTAVEAAVLPGYVPADDRYRVQQSDVRYERWDAVLCERPVSYLVGFWPSPEGGTMFQVSHPLPADVPPGSR